MGVSVPRYGVLEIVGFLFINRVNMAVNCKICWFKLLTNVYRLRAGSGVVMGGDGAAAPSGTF